MHMPADPTVMQQHAHYRDVVSEVRDYLIERAALARASGVSEYRIDPGIGFGKAVQHNLLLLNHLDVLVRTGWPVMLGTSRKSFLGILDPESLGTASPAAHRLVPTAATTAWAINQGVDIGRVHDVRPPPRRLSSLRRPAGRERTRDRGRCDLKGKWAKGIPPRFFAWIIKGRLAVSERPGGYARNHRKVRRHEEILWLRGEGFTRIVSLLPSPHNLHAYDELGVTWSHSRSALTTTRRLSWPICTPT